MSCVGLSVLLFCVIVIGSEGFTYYKNQLLKHTPKDFPSIYERKFAWNYGRESDGFGRSVDIYGDKMIVGSCFSDMDNPDRKQAGSAHIFTLKNTQRGWSYEAELWTNQTKAKDFFGWDVGLEQDLAIVGAWQHDSGFEDNGAVYFFQHVSAGGEQFWNMTAKVIGLGNYEFLGISVAFPPGAEYALVGAAGGKDDNGQNVGKAYILGRVQKSWGVSWTILTDLYPSSGSSFDYFGISVSVHDLIGAVGAYGHNSGLGDISGAVYVYSAETSQDASEWDLQAKLVASDGKANDFFGRAVAIYDSTLAVGADGADDSGEKSGAVYMFTRVDDSRWSQSQKLIPPSDNENEFFGGSVDIYNDYMIVGADGDNHNEVRTGTAYFYKRNRDWNGMGAYQGEYWQVVYQLYATDRSGRDLYGSDVALHDKSILIGAEVGDGYDYNTGTAYVYTTAPDFHWLNEGLSSGVIAGISIACLVVVVGVLGIAYSRGMLDSIVTKLGMKAQSPKLYRADFDDSRRGPVHAMDSSNSAHSSAPLNAPSASSSSTSADGQYTGQPYLAVSASHFPKKSVISVPETTVEAPTAPSSSSLSPPPSSAPSDVEMTSTTNPMQPQGTSASAVQSVGTSALQLSEFGDDDDDVESASQLKL